MSFRMTDDTRVTCTTCANLRGGLCTQSKRAGFVPQRIEIGSTLANLPQHCPAYVQPARPNFGAAQKNTKSA